MIIGSAGPIGEMVFERSPAFLVAKKPQRKQKTQ